MYIGIYVLKKTCWMCLSLKKEKGESVVREELYDEDGGKIGMITDDYRSMEEVK